MATKDTFTKEEWKDLQWAVMLAGSHVTASDWPGLWKSFKEAAGGSRFLTMMQSSDNSLVAALANDQARKRPPDISDRAGLAGDIAIERIRTATAIVAEKAPEDLEDWRHLLVNVAQAMAEEVDGVSDKESAAVQRVREAVGLSAPAPAVAAPEPVPAAAPEGDAGAEDTEVARPESVADQTEVAPH